MNPILLDLGIVQIYWYSVIIFFAMLIASFILIKSATKEGLDKEFITNLIFYSIIFGIIGARIYYVLFNLNYYLKNPLEIIAVWNGGLAIHGGIIGGALCLLYHCLKYKKSILKLTDLIVPSLILAQGIGRWGNFFNGEAHGPATTKEALVASHIPEFVIKGMKIGGTYYEPTFFYESIWCIIGFIVLMILKKKVKLRRGGLTAVYFIWYSIVRFFIEAKRTDSLMIGDIKVAQAISVILFLFGLYLLFRKKKDTRLTKLRERVEKYERLRL